MHWLLEWQKHGYLMTIENHGLIHHNIEASYTAQSFDSVAWSTDHFQLLQCDSNMIDILANIALDCLNLKVYPASGCRR